MCTVFFLRLKTFKFEKTVSPCQIYHVLFYFTQYDSVIPHVTVHVLQLREQSYADSENGDDVQVSAHLFCFQSRTKSGSPESDSSKKGHTRDYLELVALP